MAFNSLTYALFFVLVLGVYWSLRGHRARLVCLLISSLIFYATWNPPFVLLLFVSIFTDHFVSHAIYRIRRERGDTPEADRSAKRYLLISIAVNLGILGFFKYATFFLENAIATLNLFGSGLSEPRDLGIILPLGISFYTFQTMSYTIDVYRGVQTPFRSWWAFSVYVTFFPQLVAGPIVRASEFEPQLTTPREIDADAIFFGVNRIFVGLIKKVLVADWLATICEPIFAEPTLYSGLSNLIAVYAYAFQIFCDFSGYVDIALGCAALLGYRLPENFRHPYLALDITDFWRRWHITLSTWLRDYLYIPLGGNRHGSLKTYRNLALTMLLGGLWHGASWNFVIWGAIHGVMLGVHRRFRRPADEPPPTGFFAVWIRRVATFYLACFAWIFFRCATFEQASDMIGQLLTLALAPSIEMLIAFVLGPILLAIYQPAIYARRRMIDWRPTGALQLALYGAMLGGLAVALALLAPPGERFIYFQF